MPSWDFFRYFEYQLQHVDSFFHLSSGAILLLFLRRKLLTCTSFLFPKCLKAFTEIVNFWERLVHLGFLSSHVCRDIGIIAELLLLLSTSFELFHWDQVYLFLLWPAAGQKPTFTERQQSVAFLCFCQSCLFQSVISWARPENHSVQF